MDWRFPLPRTHTSILLGNGLQGLMVWGRDSLHITISRAGFWDHRGGNDFATRATFAETRRLLETGDEPGLRALFAPPNDPSGHPARPHQLGGGRLELRFPDQLRPVSGTLLTREGRILVTLRNDTGRTETVEIDQSRHHELAWIRIPASLQPAIRLVPAWNHIHADLRGVQPPEPWQDHDEHGGFLQSLPEDPPLALAWQRRPGVILLATALGPKARTEVIRTLQDADPDHEAAAARTWWTGYWRDIPELQLPDAALQEAWEYGVCKQAGLTPPGAVAATLQGPWMEEYQVPPWSNDYHFNINVQMIYWPALATGRWDHFEPLWRMIRGWFPKLRAQASHFFGNDRALMLPHAVDDRCMAVGAFWTGMIDQACTAWMAQMAWLHYRYSLDLPVLRETAWPLLTGAFEGYWSMLEERDGRLHLPVSVSPEFKGARMDAWGRNASFQLAACHALVRILPQAALILGEPVDPRWDEVARKLPPYATIIAPRQKDYPEQKVERIALWEGMDLLESHRHHSHLGGLFPFATIDPRDPAHRAIVEESLYHWVRTGAGAWSGWCLPWAAILCARVGWADAAVAWLTWWRTVFTNEGRGTLHDAAFAGCSTLFDTGSGDPTSGPDAHNSEIMQMDAGMGVVAALCELLVQDRPDGLHVLPAIPAKWPEFSFRGLHAPGGLRIDAIVREGRPIRITLHARAHAPVILHHTLGPAWTHDGTPATGSTFRTDMQPGQTIVLEAIEPSRP